METIALVLFAVAAVGGLVLAMKHFRGAALPMPVALIHGAVAAVALVMVLLAYRSATVAGLGRPLVLLTIAAVGGFFLFSFHLRGQRAPNTAVVIHALVAVAGVITLALVVL